MRGILEDIDDALYEAYKMPNIHRYEYWLDWLRVVAVTVDLQMHDSVIEPDAWDNHVSGMPNDQKSLIFQDIKDMYIRHLKYSCYLEDDKYFKLLVEDIDRELGNQFVALGSQFRERGGAPRLNPVTIERNASLLKECFLLFVFKDLVKVTALKQIWLEEILLTSFRVYAEGLGGNIMWRLKPFEDKPGLLKSCIEAVTQLSIESFDNKKEDIFKDMVSNFKPFFYKEILNAIEADYGKEYVSLIKNKIIKIDKHIQSFIDNKSSKTSLALDTLYLNRCKAHLQKIIELIPEEMLE